MTRIASKAGASTLWIILLTAASTATTLVLACATPFPALAALAAVHMRRRDGLELMGLAWLASQATGLFILHYEIRDTTYGWAAGLAVAGLASGWAAHATAERLGMRPTWQKLGAAYLTGFIAFKLVVLAFGLWLGDGGAALDPGVIASQFARNGAILLGLFALYRGLVALGVPPAPSADGRLAAA
jgi:hypothetical protein